MTPPAPTPHPHKPPPLSGRRAARTGWLLVGGLSVVVVLLSPLTINTPAALLVVGSLMLLLFVGMLVALGLLMWGYREFFGRARGFLSLAVFFLLSIYLSARTLPPDIHPLASAAVTTFVMWGAAAAFAVGPALLIYLIRTDRGVVAFAITYLLLVWLLFSVGQYLGWDVLVDRLMFGQTGAVLWPLQGGLCLAMWVTIAAVAAFIWNTAHYLRAEQLGVARNSVARNSVARNNVARSNAVHSNAVHSEEE